MGAVHTNPLLACGCDSDEEEGCSMERQYRRKATTIRLNKETDAMIRKLSEQTGATQSEILRHLIDTSLGREEPIAVRQVAEVPDDVKRELFSIADEIAGVRMQLAKIGANINVRRRNYNGERKELMEKIDALKKMAQRGNAYEKIKYAEKIQKEEDRLSEFDSEDPKLVTSEDWEKFQDIKKEFERIILII